MTTPLPHRLPILPAAVMVVVLAAAACAPPSGQLRGPSAPVDPGPGRSVVGTGYTLGPLRSLAAYTVRIDPSAAVATADVASALARLNEHTGIVFTLGPPPGAGGPTRGEVIVRSGMSCDTANEGGCTTLYGTSLALTAAAITLAPSLLADRTLLRAAVLHEFGHAAGLAHHAELHLGRRQIMGSGGDDGATDYLDGDVAGLIAQGRRSGTRT
ncbi:MAG: hypothetical protein ACOYOP_15445 [Microthrixaceae bacterium]